MRVLILYTELAGYNLPSLKALAEGQIDIHLVRWPVNKEAPFDFGEIPGVTVYERGEYDNDTLLALAERLQPSALYVAGWMDKGYTAVARHWRAKGVPVICALDNHWRGDIRQRIASWISPWHVKRMFSHLWVPGLHQYEFARRLGYAPTEIRTGMYSADVAPFMAVNAPTKETDADRELLYVGRFVDVKGVRELVEAFTGLLNKKEEKWTLRMVGAGPLQGTLPAHPKVIYQDFVQPSALPDLAAKADAFILPSHFEPWGVVLHEFAAAGLPLLASDACGSATAFLRDGYNGFSFKAKEPVALKQALKRLFEAPNEDLELMGKRSRALSQQITPESWAATFLSMAR